MRARRARVARRERSVRLAGAPVRRPDRHDVVAGVLGEQAAHVRGRDGAAVHGHGAPRGDARVEADGEGRDVAGERGPPLRRDLRALRLLRAIARREVGDEIEEAVVVG